MSTDSIHVKDSYGEVHVYTSSKAKSYSLKVQEMQSVVMLYSELDQRGETVAIFTNPIWVKLL